MATVEIIAAKGYAGFQPATRLEDAPTLIRMEHALVYALLFNLSSHD